MLYSKQNRKVYYGDKAHWQDIALTSERPSQFHTPVIEDGEHTGWEVTPESHPAIIADYERRIEQLLDAEAHSRTYNSIESIAKYLGYDNAFRAEAEELGAWVAETWTTAHGILNAWQESQATESPQPIPEWPDIEAQLPTAP